jgi:hypothetical protein
MPARPPDEVSRRRFLAGTGAMAGAVLLGACGDDGDGAGTGTTEAAASGLSLVQFFGGPPMFAAGSEVRAPFGVADGDGILPVEDTPEVLTVSLEDAGGKTVVPPTEVRRRSSGLPRAYFPLLFTVEGPGIYTGRTEVGGEELEMAIKVDAPDDVQVIRPGDALPPIETPTTDDARGVDPVCTNDPVCELHDVTVAEALQEGRPIGLLVATPAFCQIAICGPVLDVLLAVADEHPEVRLLHAEVYANPREELDTKTAAVDELHLAFEPCLVLAGADGTVVERIDTIYDEDEVGEALARLVAQRR